MRKWQSRLAVGVPLVFVLIVGTLSVRGLIDTRNYGSPSGPFLPTLGQDTSTIPSVVDTTVVVPSEEPTKETSRPDYVTRSEELKALPDEQCGQIDAYTFMAPPGPLVLDSGATFRYHCETDFWGWYHDGRPEDTWSRETLSPDRVHEGQGSVQLPIEVMNLPRNLHHPAYPEALTLSQLRPGLMVCLHSPLPQGRQDFIVEAVYAYAYRTLGGTVAVFPALDSSKSAGGSFGYSLEDIGVISYSFGVWSAGHLTVGPCRT